jgi:hypothetical protein
MHPIGVLLTALFSIMAFALPRGGALLGVLGGTCYVSQFEGVDVSGFHMYAIRIVCLVALARTVARGELAAIRFNAIDKSVVIFCMYSSVVFIVRSGFSGSAIVGQLGIIYNLLVAYFVCRALVQDYEDFTGFLSLAAVFIVPLALMMNVEAQTGVSVLTGMGAESRSGHFRCEGAFRSPITGGTFGATLLPLFAGLWFTPGRRLLSTIGMCAAVAIVISSRSSGPLLACGAGVLGLLAWRLRAQMSKIRRGFVVAVVALHLYMKAPVWFLMGRISDVVGGGGYHRAEIVDAAVKNFRSWWFCGTNFTSDWVGAELAIGGADLTNQFVVEGVRSGLMAMLLFIWIIVRCFRAIGLAVERAVEENPALAIMVWAMGATLFATVVNFFSVSYFDQIEVLWLLLLAAIVSVTSTIVSLEAAVPAQEGAVIAQEAGVTTAPQSEKLEPLPGDCPGPGHNTA